MGLLLGIDAEEVARFCRREHIRRLAVFGSAARGEAEPESDLDLLVEFEPGAHVGLSFFRIQDELSSLFGRKVDLNTPGFLGPGLLERVQKDVLPLYEAA
jgi:uncharacterized protein